ncbi:MAG: FtsW/RodA/SpoVE family cell cycle protein [Planctomycetota bacterium]
MRPGWTILLCVLSLLGVGLVMVQSAGMNVDPIPRPEPLDFSVGAADLVVPETPAPDDPALADALLDVATSRPAIYAALALLATAIAASTPAGLLRRLDQLADVRRPALVLAGVTLALLAVLALVYVPGLQREAKGAARWIEVPAPVLGTASFQPSELTKWVLPAAIAAYAAACGTRLRDLGRGLLPAGVAIGTACGLIVLEDLGTAVLIAAACGLVLFAGGMRWWHLGALATLAVAGAWQAVRTSPYRMERITSFLDPWASPRDGGYHMIQSLAAIAGGEGTGRGLGNGLHKLGYLPEDTTDFLFAIICEELGIVGAAMVLGLFGLLIWACVGVVRGEQGPVARLVALGIAGTVAMQALMNLSVVAGLGPTKGIALPLVSAGGTGWVLTGASLGLLVAMDRRQARAAAGEEAPRRASHAPTPRAIVEPRPPRRPRSRRRTHPAEVVA